MASLKDTTLSGDLVINDTVKATGYTIDEINAVGDKSLVTKEYLDSVNNFRKVKKIISTSGYTQMAVWTEDDKILTWGNNLNNCHGIGVVTDQKTPVEVQFPPADVATGIKDASVVAHSGYVLFNNGNLYVWGYNASGNLGLNDITTRTYPVLSATNVESIIPPENVSYQISQFRFFITKTTDNYFYGCGYNGYGGLGLGHTSATNVWTQIGTYSKLTYKLWNFGGTYGGTFLTSISGNGALACGYNTYGQLGTDATPTNINSTFLPVLSVTTENIINVESASGYYSAAAYGYGSTFFVTSAATNKLYACGFNAYGQLMNSATTQLNTPTATISPVAPSSIGNVHQIGMVGTFVEQVYSGDTIGYWKAGYNAHGQMHTGNTTTQIAIAYESTSDANQKIWTFSNGHTYSYVTTVFVYKGGKLYASGEGANGQCGRGTAVANNTGLAEVLIPNPEMIIQVEQNGYDATGFYYHFLMSDGRLYATGYGGRNGIGDGTVNDAWVPRRVRL